MKTILIETCGTPIQIDVPEPEVSYYLGGAPLTFAGTINQLDIVVLIKEDSQEPENPYRVPGVQSFRGRALVIQTDGEGVPIDLDFDAYDEYYEWFNQPVSRGTRSRQNEI